MASPLLKTAYVSNVGVSDADAEKAAVGALARVPRLVPYFRDSARYSVHNLSASTGLSRSRSSNSASPLYAFLVSTVHEALWLDVCSAENPDSAIVTEFRKAASALSISRS